MGPENDTFQIFLQNSQGRDLLNPATEGSYDPDSIMVFYLQNGQFEPAIYNNLSRPQMWSVGMDSVSRRYFLSVIASLHLDKNNVSTTLIGWNSRQTDTVRCRLSNRSMFASILTIWDNSRLAWDSKTDTTAGIFRISFTLTK